MKKKLFTLMTVLLIAMLATSPVAAGGRISLSGAPTANSPLRLDGSLTGVGGYDPLGVTVILTGFGIPVVECTNPGASANPAPGQNPSAISVSGSETIGGQDITKNGKAPVSVAVEDLIGTTIDPATQGGCANDNWTATITAIQWTGAFVDVYNNNAPYNLLLHAVFTCAPSLTRPSGYDCTRVS